MTETELRRAALVHAGMHLVDGRRVGSPLVALIPDDAYPPPEVILLVDRITGKEVDLSDLGGASTEQWAARVRAHLNRWAVKNGGSLEAYHAHWRAAAIRAYLTVGH